MHRAGVGREGPGEVAAALVAHRGAAADDEADADDAEGAPAGEGAMDALPSRLRQIRRGLAGFGDGLDAEEEVMRPPRRRAADDVQPDAGAAHGVAPASTRSSVVGP